MLHTFAAGNQTIHLDLPDNWDAPKVNNAKALIIDALVMSNQILDYVEHYLFDKLMPGAARPQKLKVLLDFYFGLKPDLQEMMYAHVMNQIVAGLQLAKTGLLAPVLPIVDVRQAGGVAGVQLQCLGMLNSSLFDQLGGFVFAPLTESVPNMFRDLFRGSSGVSKVEFRPKAGTIHLNFELMQSRLGQAPLIGAHTLIHEATHKFAHTTDVKYFDVNSELVQRRIDDKIRQRNDDHETVVAETWNDLKSTFFGAEMGAMYAQQPSHWAGNADSLAHLAVDIYTWILNG